MADSSCTPYGFRPWARAWHEALYGAAGFYRNNLPGNHFRTASHAGADLLAEALAVLLRRYGLTRLVEVGAGAGELLSAVHSLDRGIALAGVEQRPRPPTLPPAIGWTHEVPDLAGSPTLLLGWELLDVVPQTIAEADPDGLLREVWVARDGTEKLGQALTPADAQWCAQWQHGPYQAGQRVEVGLSRDEYWAQLVNSLPVGLAVAVDYAAPGNRARETGTLVGYRRGHVVDPRPDGTCDLTSHVRWDSLTAAIETATGTTSTLLSQRNALADLLAEHPVRLPVDLRTAGSDPARYLEGLARRSRLGELIEPGGLGDFGWLLSVRP